MKVRGKFEVSRVSRTRLKDRVEVEMQAVFGGTPEDDAFHRATPMGKIGMTVDNPNLIDAFDPGQTFYVDFTEVTDG